MLNTYFGWRITWTLAWVEFTLYGILYYTFGVFLSPLERETGWTRAQTSLGFSLALLVAALLAPAVGRFVDRHGARALMTGGALLGAALTFAWSRVTSLPAFYAVWTAMGLAWAAVFYPVAFTVIAVWFRRDRPKAMLLVTLVAGLASTAFIPLATFLLERFGWRSSVALLSGVVALCAVPLWLFVRHRPADLGLHPDGLHPNRAALEHSSPTLEPDLSLQTVRRQPAFWWLTLAFALNAASTVALAAHLVPLLLERGLSPALSAVAAGAVGLTSLLGRALFTPSAFHFSLNRSSLLVFAVQALALLSLLTLPLSWGLWPFVLLMGASNGAATLSKAGLIAELYGSRNYGAVSGLITLWMGLTAATAPLLVGVLHTALGGYTPVLWGLAACSLLGLVALARAEQARVSAFSSTLEGNS